MSGVYSARASEIVREYRQRFSAPQEKAQPRSGANLQQEPEHELVLTGKRNTNGRILVVRCRCMAEYRAVSCRYYNYDPLGEARSLDEVRDLYQAHLDKERS